MREQVERKLFPYVIRPGRYAGGEPGQVKKDPQGLFQVLLAIPDRYEVGQPDPLLNNLYHLINHDARFLCERAFAVDRDAEEIMRREGIALFSLESSRSATEFDVILFIIQNRLQCTNLLQMLDLAGVPARYVDRQEDDPVIVATGPGVMNPEPIAPFIDFFLFGDVETSVPQLLTVLNHGKSKLRHVKLQSVNATESGVYCPQVYDEKRRPSVDNAPQIIRATFEGSIDQRQTISGSMLPLIETDHDRLIVEAGRNRYGCYDEDVLPDSSHEVRVRKVSDVVSTIEGQLVKTGFDEVYLYLPIGVEPSYAVQLVTQCARVLDPFKSTLALSPLLPNVVSSALLDAVGRIRKSALTLAPVAGTDRLRKLVGFDIRDEQIVKAARLIFDKGWQSLRLKFWIGLPTETDDDAVAVARLVREISEQTRGMDGKRTLTVILIPFVAEPQTPFQWDEPAQPDSLQRRLGLIKANCRGSRIHIRHEAIDKALLNVALVRGGKEFSAVIEDAYTNGYRFDNWLEEYQSDLWLSLIEKHGLKAHDYLKAFPFDAVLPWSHIQFGKAVNELRALRGALSSQLHEQAVKSTQDTVPTGVTPSLEFGRARKKVASRVLSAPTKNRLRVRWGKSGQYRYMSHLDNIRTIERAIRRAKLPVAYSQGYSPSMKLSFGPPLPLGFTSEAELVDITLETNLLPSMVESLKRALPDGVDIKEARVVLSKQESLTAALNRVVYRLPLQELGEGADLVNRISGLLDAEHLTVTRTTKSDTKELDVRPAIYDLAVTGDSLVMTLGIGEGGYVRPEEVLELLNPDWDTKALSHRCHRVQVFRQDERGDHIDAMDL